MATDRLPPGLEPPGVLILAGPFGSGKTEIAINLAERWARECPTYLADLDVVTPYYRSRDAGASLLKAGVRLLSPGGDAGAYDVPVLSSDVGRALADRQSGLVVDVGGQPHGAGVLLHWREPLLARQARTCLVVNPRRPGVASAHEVAKLAEAIAGATGLPMTGLIANGNLGPRTAAQDVAAGVAQARELEAHLGVPTLAVCCAAHLAGECAQVGDGLPILTLSFHMRPPWASHMAYDT
jgi:hypothetical protein